MINWGSNWQAGQEFRAAARMGRGSRISFSCRDMGGGQFSDFFFESLFGGGFAQQGRRGSAAQRGEDLRAKIEITLEEAYHGSSPTISLNMPEMDSKGHLTTKQKSLRIKIPAGVIDGAADSLSGQGAEGIHGGQKEIFI